MMHLNLSSLLIAIPIGIIVAFFLFWMTFALCYTVILVRYLSSETTPNISIQSCGYSSQTKKSTNIANYSYAIKYCISRGIYFFDVLRIIRTGRYRPSEGENLNNYHNHRRRKNNEEDDIIGTANSPFPNILPKPIDKVIHSATKVSQEEKACQPKTNGTLFSDLPPSRT